MTVKINNSNVDFLIIPPFPEGGGGYTVLPLSVLPSVQDIFRRIFLSNCWWQKSDIWSQASYRYTILWVAFLDPSDSYFLFADFVDFYTHWTYMLIFRRIFLSNYWWQKSDIWSQASYRYPISWEAFFDPSDSYFLFAEERGYQVSISSQFILLTQDQALIFWMRIHSRKSEVNQNFLTPIKEYTHMDQIRPYN